MAPSTGEYTILVSKFVPKGLSAPKTGTFCFLLVKFSPPKYHSNCGEKT